MARKDAHGKRFIEVNDEDGITLEFFEFNVTGIRSVKGWIQGFWSLNLFSEALTGRNGFSDVDGHTEIDGHSLILEFKHSLFKMTKGQTMKAVRQARFQRTSTWFIEGSTDNPTYMIQVNSTGKEGEFEIGELTKVDIDSLRQFIRLWEEWARKNSLVKGKKTEEWEAVNEIMDRCLEIRE